MSKPNSYPSVESQNTKKPNFIIRRAVAGVAIAATGLVGIAGIHSFNNYKEKQNTIVDTAIGEVPFGGGPIRAVAEAQEELGTQESNTYLGFDAQKMFKQETGSSEMPQGTEVVVGKDATGGARVIDVNTIAEQRAAVSVTPEEGPAAVKIENPENKS